MYSLDEIREVTVSVIQSLPAFEQAVIAMLQVIAWQEDIQYAVNRK